MIACECADDREALGEAAHGFTARRGVARRASRAVYFDMRRSKSAPARYLTPGRRRRSACSTVESIFGIRNGSGVARGRADEDRLAGRHAASAISASNADDDRRARPRPVPRPDRPVTFTDHAWLLVAGQLPTPAQRRILDATLVAIAEHGLVPSVAASRMTLAAAPEAIQGAVAAGILGCGSVILGSAESAARFCSTASSRARAAARRSRRRRVRRSSRRASRSRAVPGYGHPLHKRADPRVGAPARGRRRSRQSRGRHVEVARADRATLPEVTGKPLVMNVSGAIAAVLLDAGFPLLAVKGVPILARTASLIAHLLEEQAAPDRLRARRRRRREHRLRRSRARRIRAGAA